MVKFREVERKFVPGMCAIMENLHSKQKEMKGEKKSK